MDPVALLVTSHDAKVGQVGLKPNDSQSPASLKSAAGQARYPGPAMTVALDAGSKGSNWQVAGQSETVAQSQGKVMTTKPLID
jgi:hypothetical protein